MPPIEPTMTPNEPDFELVDESAEPHPLPLARSVYSRRLQTWVRGILVVFAVGFLTVFGIAAWLNPYNADGSPRTMATHTQLGMPPCTMVTMFGKPCPSCGMTTSFALLIHGDVPNSLRANWAGTLLAAYCMILIPWTAVCAARGRYYFVRSGEALITASVVVMLVVMLGRWAFVLLQ